MGETQGQDLPWANGQYYIHFPKPRNCLLCLSIAFSEFLPRALAPAEKPLLALLLRQSMLN